MSKFYVIKKSAGYAVKTFRNEEVARDVECSRRSEP